jgi:hypothetical protein
VLSPFAQDRPLPLIKEGQEVSITARGIPEKAEGKIVFISPVIDKESRTARVVAEIANGSGVWRPGSFVTTAIAFEEQPVTIAVPTVAIQTMGTGSVAFVRTPEGFQNRQVMLDRIVEVVSGLRHGEVIAVSNRPLEFACRSTQIVAALLAGNCVVLKPPESSPLALIRSVMMFAEALPLGTIKVVTGLPITLPASSSVVVAFE